MKYSPTLLLIGNIKHGVWWICLIILDDLSKHCCKSSSMLLLTALSNSSFAIFTFFIISFSPPLLFPSSQLICLPVGLNKQTRKQPAPRRKPCRRRRGCKQKREVRRQMAVATIDAGRGREGRKESGSKEGVKWRKTGTVMMIKMWVI